VKVRTLLAGVVLAVALLLPGAATSGRQKPYVLTAVASIGTVYWRYDFVHYRTPRWSLGVRIFYTATTDVTFRAGKMRLRRTLQPQQLRWLPFRTNRLQKLSLVQATEPGTLRAAVTVKFGRHNSQSYLPPRVTTQLQPRG
jgi:hypothetical protein